MPRTVAYLRVSTQEQAGEGHSLGAQQEKAFAYAALHDLGEPEMIFDKGYSGGSMDRPGLRDLIRRCKTGEVDHVIVVSLDRLSRRIRDTLYLVAEVFDGHVVFHSVRETLDTGSAAGRFVLNIMASVNELERDLISERTSAALREKSRKGERIGRAPLGFREQPGELVEDRRELVTVRRVFKLRAEGHTLRGIAERLTEEGHRTKRGGAWAPATVSYILRNPRYSELRELLGEAGEDAGLDPLP